MEVGSRENYNRVKNKNHFPGVDRFFGISGLSIRELAGAAGAGPQPAAQVLRIGNPEASQAAKGECDNGDCKTCHRFQIPQGVALL
jgi:hypothetical protein